VEVTWGAGWPLSTSWREQVRRRPITVSVPFELGAVVNGKHVRLHPTMVTTLRFAAE
jgi:hypothetical protein